MLNRSLTVKILKRTKELIQAGWIQRWWAHNIYGCPVPTTCSTAVRFCILGALEKSEYEIVPLTVYGRSTGITRFLAEYKGKHVNLAEYNDKPGRRKSTIVRYLDGAIKAAENLPDVETTT